MRPQLKSVVWERADDGRLRLVYDRRDQLFIADETGAVARLLELLRDGGRTVAQLAGELSLPVDEVAAAIAELDTHLLLEDGDALAEVAAGEAERHFSNLAFFESFATLARSRVALQRALRDAHVLVLGTGGLNSNVVPHLSGMGVGRFTLLDRDVVEVRNFARQYLYRHEDIGARKVERAANWIRSFDPDIEVETIDGDITGAEQIGDLVARFRPDIVASGVDQPAEVDEWVNAACVAAGTPFVRGGMWVTEGIVWSVDPHNSPCLRCSRREPDTVDAQAAEQRAAYRLYRTKPRVNRGIGPVAGVLGSLAAFEIVRYLTGFEPPQYAGRPVFIDFAAGCAMERLRWQRDPACPVCGPAQGPVPVLSGTAGGNSHRAQPTGGDIR